jgi:hypothetical protein
VIPAAYSWRQTSAHGLGMCMERELLTAARRRAGDASLTEYRWYSVLPPNNKVVGFIV